MAQDEFDLSGLYEPDETPAPEPRLEAAGAKLKNYRNANDQARPTTHATEMPFMEAAAIGNKINPEDRIAAARALYGPHAIIEKDSEGGIAIRKPNGESHYIEEPTIAPWNPQTWKKENIAQLSEPILSRGATALAGGAMGGAAGSFGLGVGAIPGAAIGTLAGLFAGPGVQHLLASTEAGGSSAEPLDLLYEGAKDVVAGQILSKAAPVVGGAFKNVFTGSGRAASKVAQAANALRPTVAGRLEVGRNLNAASTFNMSQDALPPAQVLADASPEASSTLNKMLSNSPTARGLEEAGTRNIAQAGENIRSSNVRPEIEAGMKQAIDVARTHPEVKALVHERELAQASGNKERVAEIDAHLKDLSKPFVPDVEGAVSAAREANQRGVVNYNKLREQGLRTVDEPKYEPPSNKNAFEDPPGASKAKIQGRPGKTTPEYERLASNVEDHVEQTRAGFQAAKDKALAPVEAAKAAQKITPGHEQILNGPNETLGVRAELAKGQGQLPEALRSRIAQKSSPGKFNNNIVDALRADGSEEAKHLLAIDEYTKKMQGNATSIANTPEHSALGRLFVRGARGLAGAVSFGGSEGALFAKRFFSNDRALRKVVENPELRTQLYNLIKEGKTPEEIGKGLASGILGSLHHNEE